MADPSWLFYPEQPAYGAVGGGVDPADGPKVAACLAAARAVANAGGKVELRLQQPYASTPGYPWDLPTGKRVKIVCAPGFKQVPRGHFGAGPIARMSGPGYSAGGTLFASAAFRRDNVCRVAGPGSIFATPDLWRGQDVIAWSRVASADNFDFAALYRIADLRSDCIELAEELDHDMDEMTTTMSIGGAAAHIRPVTLADAPDFEGRYVIDARDPNGPNGLTYTGQPGGLQFAWLRGVDWDVDAFGLYNGGAAYLYCRDVNGSAITQDAAKVGTAGAVAITASRDLKMVARGDYTQAPAPSRPTGTCASIASAVNLDLVFAGKNASTRGAQIHGAYRSRIVADVHDCIFTNVTADKDLSDTTMIVRATGAKQQNFTTLGNFGQSRNTFVIMQATGGGLGSVPFGVPGGNPDVGVICNDSNELIIAGPLGSLEYSGGVRVRRCVA